MNQQGYNQQFGRGLNQQNQMMGNQMGGNQMGNPMQQMGGNPMQQMGGQMMGNQMQMGNQMGMMNQQQQPMMQVPMMGRGNPMMGSQPQMVNPMQQMQQVVTTTTQMVGGGMGGMVNQMMGFSAMVDPLQQFFQLVDKDGSGTISAPELQEALNSTPQNLKVSIEGCRLLVKMFQSKGFRTFQTKKELTFMEFKVCYTYVRQVLTFFNQVDSDQSGTLNQQELYRACQLSGYKMDFSTFSNIFKRFTHGREGYSRNSMNVGQFIELSIFLATIMKYFTVHKRGFKGSSHRKMKMSVNDKTEMTFGQLVETVGFFKFGF